MHRQFWPLGDHYFLEQFLFIASLWKVLQTWIQKPVQVIFHQLLAKFLLVIISTQLRDDLSLSINENQVRRGWRNRYRDFFWVGDMGGSGGSDHKSGGMLAIFVFDWRGGWEISHSGVERTNTTWKRSKMSVGGSTT